MNQKCPCCSGKEYEMCCKPFLEMGQKPQTAEQVMRSRYTAFCVGQINYILESSHPHYRKDIDLKSIRQWSEQSEWVQLEIVNVQNGLGDDDTGIVEFIAHYRQQGHDIKHHEIGHFLKHQGMWYYTHGRTPSIGTVRHEGPKLGRNDPCVCGSGKKYKKCCGANV